MASAKLTKQSQPAMHSAGIFADMTVDGPEVGTLVVVVDRAKNLPNKRTMGKQDPYCACRLGKEAKKTDTDKRGGQVPRWDQELRYIVRDSPDYNNLKVSVFNDDKKTELIGETWIELADVIKPGGGQVDGWHNLNCKGKYAGEIRMEMTYYDSRPKPERPEESIADGSRESSRSMNGSRQQTPVRRRPLPTDPTDSGTSPADQARPLPSAGGPRELGSSARPLPQPHGKSRGSTPSSQRRSTIDQEQPQAITHRLSSQQSFYPETPDDLFGQHSAPARHRHDTAVPHGGYEPYLPPPQQQQDYGHYGDNPDTGLPELPPMRTSRRPASRQTSHDPIMQNHDYSTPPRRPEVHHANSAPPRQPELHHAQSAPVVPQQAPYPETMMFPREVLHHTQSAGHMNHTQNQPTDYREQAVQRRTSYQPSEYETSAGYNHSGRSPSVQPTTTPEGYDHIPAESMYRRLSDTYQQRQLSDSHRDRRPSDPHRRPSVDPYQEDAPPPPLPPAHRGSSNHSSTRPPSFSNYTPQPLNITPSRRSPSPYMYQDQGHYSTSPAHAGHLEFDGASRRSTEPIDYTPQDQHYRPRAMSGEANRYENRPPSRERQYALPPSHPEYHSPITGTPPDFPDSRMVPARRRESYIPTQPSPLARDAPGSFRGDLASLPSQQNMPSGAGNMYSQSPPKVASTPPRAYGSHNYSTSEPYVPPTAYQTPPRQHPLSQQMHNNSSPNGYGQPTPPQDRGPPLVRPIARPAHATPQSEPRLSRSVSRSTPTMRKSLSPHPSPSEQQRPPSTHFDPDSFNQFNPSASSTSLVNHPATSSHGSTPGRDTPLTREGKIVDFHGNHIDPSDRLPESIWAPEPEPKGNAKEKSSRDRERIYGARDLNITISSRASPRGSLSAESPGDTPTSLSKGSGAGMIRARLKKKERPVSALVTSETANERPFSNIPSPSSAGLPVQHSPGGFPYSSPSWPGPGADRYGGPSPDRYGGTSPDRYGGAPSYGGGYGSSPGGGGAAAAYGSGSPAESPYSRHGPPLPAKVPLGGSGGYGGGGSDNMSALSAEMSTIDIGSGSRVPRTRMLGYHR